MSVSIHRHAATVDAAAESVASTRAVVEGLATLRWRSPAALAYRAEVEALVDDLTRTRARLDDLAADLRRLAALLEEGSRG